MSTICAQCGVGVAADTSLCLHHTMIHGDDWAQTNRIWCDYFHRRVPIKRLYSAPLTDDKWGNISFGGVPA